MKPLEAFRRILGPHPAGLSIAEVKQAWDLLGMPALAESQIATRLYQHRRHFENRDGRWLDRRHLSRSARGREDGAPPVPMPTGGNRYVVLDIESTGTDVTSDEPVELAAVKVEDGRIIDRWSSLAKPSRPMGEGATLVTGLSDEDLAGAPPPGEALAALAKFIGDWTRVGHNIGRFDLPMLEAAAARHGVAWPAAPVVDTMELAVLFWPTLSSHALPSLWDAFFPGEGGYEAHRALGDCEANQRVFEAMRARVAREDGHLAGRIASDILAKGDWPAAHFLALPPGRGDLEDVMAAIRPRILPVRPAGEAGVVGGLRTAAGSLLDGMGLPRPGQTEMLGEVADCLSAGGTLMVEAPTGTGKTRAYLLPAVLHAMATGSPVLVVPHTRLLQDQILAESASLPVPHRICRYMGKQNLVCRMHLEQAVDVACEAQERLPLAYRLALAQVLVALLGETEGFLRDINTWWLDQGDDRGLGRSLRRDLAVGEGCREAMKARGMAPEDDRRIRCWAKAMEVNCERTHLLVANHVMILRNLEFLAMAGLLGATIVDEAHRLEDSATLAWTSEVTPEVLDGIRDRILSPDGRRGLARVLRPVLPDLAGQLAGWCDGLDAQAGLLAVSLRQYLDRQLGVRQVEREGGDWVPAPGRRQAAIRLVDRDTRDWQEVDREIGILRDMAGALLDMIAEPLEAQARREPLPDARRPLGRDELRDLQDLIDLVEELCGQLDSFRALSNPETWLHVVEASDEPDGRILWSLKVEPLEVGGRLAGDFHARVPSLVLVSATLTIEGTFNFIRSRIGLDTPPGWRDQVRCVQLPPAFDYKANALLVTTRHLPAPRGKALNGEFAEAAGRELARFVVAMGGNVLGLFTSRNRMEAVARRVSSVTLAHGLRILVQSGGLHRQVEAFRQEDGSSLFGVATLWEGISVEGPALSHVVMSKLPFPFQSPLHRARAELASARHPDNHPFLALDLPLAVMTFKQGFGRLNRTPMDRGSVVVLDRRLQSGLLYRDMFLGSLPGSPSLLDAADEHYMEAIASFLGRSLPGVLPPVARPSSEALLARFLLPPGPLRGEGLALHWPRVLEALGALFGFEGFRPGQEELVRAQLEGRDVLAVLPTGAGKSLAFQLPALLQQGLVLVISPLVALMEDQVQDLLSRFSSHVVGYLRSPHGDAGRAILQDVAAGRMRLLYMAPETLALPAVRQALPPGVIRRVVLDEAHCATTWGDSFRPEYRDVFRTLDALSGQERIPVTALSATAPPGARTEIRTFARMEDPVSVIMPLDRPNIALRVFHAGDDRAKRRILLQVLAGLVKERGQSGLVYVRTQAKAMELAHWLRQQGIAADGFHGSLEHRVKQAIQHQFMNDALDVVVATVAFGMGVDKPDVRFVVHYDVPQDAEALYQAIGRAGRDGEPAVGIVLHATADVDAALQLSCRDVGTAVVQAAWRAILDAPCDDLGRRLPDPGGEAGPGAAATAWWSHFARLGLTTFPSPSMGRVRLRVRRGVHLGDAGLDGLEGALSLLEALRGTADPRRIWHDISLIDWLGGGSGRPVELRPLQALLAELERREVIELEQKASARHVRILNPDPSPALDLAKARRDDLVSRMRALVRILSGSVPCRWREMRVVLGDDLSGDWTCGRCDRCAPDRSWPWPGEPVQEESIRSAGPALHHREALLRALGGLDGRWGKVRTASFLAGAGHRDLQRKHLMPAVDRSLPWFGSLSALGVEGVLRLLGQLEDEGWVEVRLQSLMARGQASGAKEYPMLHLSAKGRIHYGGQAREGGEEGDPDGP